MANGTDKKAPDDVGEYSSPACSMHEVDPAYMWASEQKPRRGKPQSQNSDKDPDPAGKG